MTLRNNLGNSYEEAELAKIINKQYLDPKEIWSITPNNFYIWRKKYDYPRIINHFSQRLSGFEDWKQEIGLENEDLINLGISNCINPNPSKDKIKYIVEQEYNNNISRFISYKNIDGKYYQLGPNWLMRHRVKSSFMGYIDWCNFRKIKILPDRNNNDLLLNYTKSYVHSPEVTVSILDGLELLKIGGIEVKTNGFDMINPKHFEFVNANYLTFRGQINTGGKMLTFQNSYVENLICDEADLTFFQFLNCQVTDFLCKNSTARQWTFDLSHVSGKAYNSDFNLVSIYGGSFDISFQGCTFWSVEARAASKKDIELENTYRTFKKIYSDQGNDSKAIEYFLLEKGIERIKAKKHIFFRTRLTLFKETKYEKLKNDLKNSISYTIKYVSYSINNFYWGYGRKPFRVVRNSIFVIILFSILYFLFQSNITIPKYQNSLTFWDSLYFSSVTFTTLGYGDFTPIGYLRIAAAIEAFLGGLSFGFLVAAFSNFKY